MLGWAEILCSADTRRQSYSLISRIYSWRTCRREVEIFILLKGAYHFLVYVIALCHMECILHWHEFCICCVISCSFLSKLRHWANEFKYNVLPDNNSEKHVCVWATVKCLALGGLFSDKCLYGDSFSASWLKVGWPPQMEFFLAVFPKVNLLPPPHVSQLSAV